MLHSGWMQIAYERDTVEGLSEVAINGQPLAIVKSGGTFTVIDAYCPHRGANLCHGGVLDGDAVACPFHGFRIGLKEGAARFVAHRFDSFVVGGMIFAKPATGRDCGLRAHLESLDETHFIVPGFSLVLEAPAELVIEKAFDAAHFKPVHKIGNHPSFSIEKESGGPLAVRGDFVVPVSEWQTSPGAEEVSAQFCARAFSPTIVLSDVGGARPYAMLTTTQPLTTRRCVARLSLILPPAPDGSSPSREACLYLLRQAQAGMEQDHVIWRAMAWPPIFNPVETDKAVSEFQDFCRTFALPPPSRRDSGGA